METLYDMIKEAKEKSFLWEGIAGRIANNAHYAHLRDRYGGAFSLAQLLEEEYRKKYEPILCQLHPFRRREYTAFDSKIEELQTIVPLEGRETLAPQTATYWGALVVPFLVLGGLSSLGLSLDGMDYAGAGLWSAALTYIIHIRSHRNRYTVFTRWQEHALAVDAIARIVTKN